MRWLIINEYRPGAIERPSEAHKAGAYYRYQILQERTYAIYVGEDTFEGYEWEDVDVCPAVQIVKERK